MDTEDYIKKWLNGSISEAEMQQLAQTPEFQAIKKLDAAVQRFKAPAYDVQQELAKLTERKNSHKSTKVIRLNWWQAAIRVAAVVVLALVGYLLIFTDKPIVIATDIAEKTTVYLPDSTMVSLNALSTLTYSAKNWSQNRQVTLAGEAYFKVAKGAKFDVETADGTVSVLGTQFNVQARPDYFEVKCFEGLVAVDNPHVKMMLPAGHMFRVIDGHISEDSTLREASPAWLANESSFISTPYKYVIKELERQYQIKVITQNIDLEQRFTGRFTHKNLDLALKSISLPLNLHYKKVGNYQIELSVANQ